MSAPISVINRYKTYYNETGMSYGEALEDMMKRAGIWRHPLSHMGRPPSSGRFRLNHAHADIGRVPELDGQEVCARSISSRVGQGGSP